MPTNPNDIPATEPDITPAVPEQTYPSWVVTSLHFNGSGITEPVTCEAWFQSSRRNAEGLQELGEKRVNYYVHDMFVLAASDAGAGATLLMVKKNLVRLATAAGIL